MEARRFRIEAKTYRLTPAEHKTTTIVTDKCLDDLYGYIESFVKDQLESESRQKIIFHIPDVNKTSHHIKISDITTRTSRNMSVVLRAYHSCEIIEQILSRCGEIQEHGTRRRYKEN